MKLAALLVTAATGCSAVSAVGSLVKPAPPQVTVNTHVEVAPAPTPVQVKPSAKTAMIGGGVAGAVAGGVGAALVSTTPEAIAGGVLVGAGVGTALGYVVHSALD